MANKPSSSIPPIHLQSPSVDFISIRLPEHHDVFKNMSYDHRLQTFVPDQFTTDRKSVVGDQDKDQSLNQCNKLSQIGDIGDFDKFWGLIFPEAISTFIKKYPKEPDALSKLGYGIRNKTTWENITSELHKAHEEYFGSRETFSGRCKRSLRKIGDNSANPASNIINLIPNIEYVSPVLGAVQLLLNAYKVTSEVRERVTSGFDEAEIQDLFKEAEIFLITFPDSSEIKDNSILLVVSVLKAIEDGIEFFLSKRINRVINAIYKGKKGYQETLLKSLEAIKTNSQKLAQKAQNTNIMHTQFKLTTIQSENRQYHNEIMEIQQTACNNILSFFDEFDNLRKQNIEMQKENDEIKKQNSEILADHKIMISTLKEISRAPTPAPPELSAIFNSQLAFTSVPATHYQHYFQPGQQSFIAYNGPMGWSDSFSKGPQQWSVSTQQRIINSLYLLDILRVPFDFDDTDLETVKDYSYQLSKKHHTRVVQVTQTREFRQWVVALTSRRLLIHGQFSPHGHNMQRTSPLSVFCLLLVHMLRERERYITLVFFCGLHADEEDSNVGGGAIIKSFISQFLRQVPFDSMPLDMTIDLDGISKGDCNISQLCDLFVWLVRHQLGRDRTLVCIIDGIGNYETDELKSDMLAVMRMLLQFCKTPEPSNSAGLTHGEVKILATTPFTAEAVQELYLGEGEDHNDNFFLTMAGLPDVSDTVGFRKSAFSLRR